MSVENPLHCDIQAILLTEYDQDNFPGIGLDGDAANTKLQPAEAQHPLGFIARPKDPEAPAEGDTDTAQAALCLRLDGGNDDYAIALGDPRCTPALPQLAKGSAMAYAPSGSDDPPRILLRGDDENIVIHVPNASKVTIEVEGGPQIVVDKDYVHLGTDAGDFVLTDKGGAIVAAFSQIQALFAGLGLTFTPPTGYIAEKTKAT